MYAHIQKWRNSLGVRIPMQIAKQLHLNPGSPVILEIEGQKIVIQSPEYELDAMLEKITKKNYHHQVFDDEQLGNEDW